MHRPVIYTSVSQMPAVLTELARAGISWDRVRLLSAHYGAGRHICGPRTCRWPNVPQCDGTQWTDHAAGVGGTLIDESVLDPAFFEEAPVPLTSSEITAIAKAVWQVGGQIYDPADATRRRTPAHVLTDTGRQVRALQASLTALGSQPVTEVAKAVLAALDPAEIAAAVAAAVGPDVAREVADELGTRLAKP